MMNGAKHFLPFHKIGDQEVIVVDGLHPQALVLSHWKGANIHESIAADTSGEIVLNAIEQGLEGLEIRNISATHFDIDGFVGVFALFSPALAMEFKEVLIEMARIGDFREFDPKNPAAEHALKLCCWMNKLEKDKFYRPFEEKDEIEECEHKFDYFLKEFGDVLMNTENYRSDWIEEYKEVYKSLSQISDREYHLELGLLFLHAEERGHYYALFSESEGFDLVGSIYPNNGYELEFKYTTWIDLASRPSLPRIDLRPLAEKLNQEEESSYVWKVDQITDTGPILRLEKDHLSKAERYANPLEREVYSSSIQIERFKGFVLDFLSHTYDGIQAKKFWKWEEMKSIKSDYI